MIARSKKNRVVFVEMMAVVSNLMGVHGLFVGFDVEQMMAVVARNLKGSHIVVVDCVVGTMVVAVVGFDVEQTMVENGSGNSLAVRQMLGLPDRRKRLCYANGIDSSNLKS
jgi:hypothetical protein